MNFILCEIELFFFIRWKSHLNLLTTVSTKIYEINVGGSDVRRTNGSANISHFW